MTNDYQKYLQLKEVISSGNYDLKGNAITTVASLILWYDSLEAKFKEPAPLPAIEPLKKPLTKPVRKKASKS